MTQPTDNPQDSFIIENVEWARHVAYDVVRDHARADDLAQSLWLEVLSKNPGDVRSPKAWIRGALRNLGLAGRRKLKVREKYESAAAAETSAEFTPTDVEEARDLVQWALARVKSPHRETIELSYLRGLDNAEIAQRLGISVDTVRSRVSRGLSQIREELRKKGLGDGRPWTILLLPLLATGRGPSRTTTRIETEETSEASAKSALVAAPSPVKKRMVVGFAVAAALILLLRLPEVFESSPPKIPTARSIDEAAVAEVPSKPRPEVASADAAAETPSNPLPPQPKPADQKPTPAHKISIVVNVIEGGVDIDVPVTIEASSHGPIAFAIPMRRPVRLTPEEQMPFVGVGSGRGLSGKAIVIDVPKDELYLLRIACDSAQNVAYAKLVPGFDGNVTLQFTRRLRVRIPRISFDTRVAIRPDKIRSTQSIPMETPDDDDDVRIATGAFLLPVNIDVDVEGLGVTASAEIKAADSVPALPPMIRTPCRVRSAADERLVDGLTVRSVVFGSDGTLWSIVTQPTSLGHCDMITQTLANSNAPNFVQFRAAGFDTTAIDGPAGTRRLREQVSSIDPSAPYDIYLAPVGYRGGGRVLDADGLPVRRGAVFVLAEGRSTYVGVVDNQGRFNFEPIMNTTALLNSKFEYRPPALPSSPISLLYEDDDDATMMHFADVPGDALVRGDWIGRLPAGRGPRIRYIDQATRRDITPLQVVILPISKDGQSLGKPLFESFFAKRRPLGGLWRVAAFAERYKQSTVTIDADRESVEIEMTAESQLFTKVILKADHRPIIGQEVEFLNSTMSMITSAPLRTNADGSVYVWGGTPRDRVRFQFKNPTRQLSVNSAPFVEIGQTVTIELCETVSVPIRATDLRGQPIDHIAVAACSDSGRRVHDELIFPEKGHVKLTREPQVLVVLDPAHNPQVISWAPPPDGIIPPIQVTMDGGHSLTMSIGEETMSGELHIAELRLIEPFVDKVTGVIPSAKWTFPIRRSIDDPMKHQVNLAPGRYRFEVTYRDKLVWEKEFDVRGDVDLGTIILSQ